MMIKQFKIDESVYVVKGVEGLEGLVGRVIGEGEMKGEVEVEFEPLVFVILKSSIK